MASVLIVEDEEVLRNVYEQILSIGNHTVTTAIDGEDGLRKLRSDSFDIVLLDILMPKIDGLELMRHASNEKLLTATKIIAFSNLSDKSKIDQMMQYGVVEHFLKSSFTPNDLIAVVDKYAPVH